MENEMVTYFAAALNYEIGIRDSGYQKILAINTGLSEAMISIAKNDKAQKPAGRVAMEKISSALGYPIDKFLRLGRYLVDTGGPPPDNRPEPIINVQVSDFDNKSIMNGMADDYRGIPLYESVRLAAGSNGMAFDPNEEPSSIVVVYKPELQGCSKHNLAAIKVGGDSMEPSIPIGSIVVVDLSDKEFAKGKVFVVNTPEAGLDIASIKRVQMWEKGFALISDNWKYPPELSPLDWDQLCVGRVVWMWKNIRNI